jgi:uncharacterized protein
MMIFEDFEDESTCCVYHKSDLDGLCSAAVVKKKLHNIKFIGWDYGMVIPDFKKYSRVILCDLSFPIETMKSLKKEKGFIWLDHHASAIKDMKELNLKGIQNTNFAACELTWQYMFPDKETPELVTLLGKYDTMRDKENISIKNLQFGGRTKLTSYDKVLEYINNWSPEKKKELQVIGSYVLEYLNEDAKVLMESAIEIEIEGYKALVINKERFNPINYGINYHDMGYDVFLCFWFRDNEWKFSIYNESGKVDVSKIAKVYGGGGHLGAAGFVLKKNEFDKLIK